MATSRAASVLERDGAKDGLISCRGRGSVKRRFHRAGTSSSDPQRNRLSSGAPMSLVRTLTYAAYLARGKKPEQRGSDVLCHPTTASLSGTNIQKPRCTEPSKNDVCRPRSQHRWEQTRLSK